MRYAVLGDVHSNLEALNEVLGALKKESIDEYLCVGDVVGYNADPKDCIKIIKPRCKKIVAGNHDWGCVGKFRLDWFRDLAKEAIAWTTLLLDDAEQEFLSNLELIYEFQNFTLVHSSLFEPEEFHYFTNLDYAMKSFAVLKTQICFLGHTHKPMVYIMDEKGEVSCCFEQRTNLEENKRYIVNVGSVGQPRDGNTRACFCIYDTQDKSIEFRRVEYDFRRTQDKIRATDLPQALALRLFLGK